ncbi:MAG: metallophosphoesterase [Thermoguttaceae bacterium]|nr:metallophosphoesterase [Thermoguttaceae bacterium]
MSPFIDRNKNALRPTLARRSFLSSMGVVCASCLGTSLANEIEELPPGVEPSNPRELLYPTPEPSKELFTSESGSFAASYPMLQNVSETSASVSWALNVPSTGWVEWGTTPNLGKIARNSEFGLNPYEENFLSARITGLSPNTTYYYRTATCSFIYRTAYDKTISEPQFSDVYSFKTVGPNVDGVSFAVMNDTHNQVDTVRKHCERHEELGSDIVIWNGDLCHRYFFPLIAKTGIANPCDIPFAAQRPIVFVPGNHDKWGPYAHNLRECLTPWRQSDSRYYSLGHNYAFRLGPIAMITLDTGDTKPDNAVKQQGIASFDPYRELQATWLEHVLSRPDIAEAPYIVAFCHIPIFNPFDEAGIDQSSGLPWKTVEPTSARMWAPILAKHNITLVISAHLHRHSFSEATPERPWPQLLGGGPLAQNATCIHAEGNYEHLTVTAETLFERSVLGTWTFEPRA